MENKEKHQEKHQIDMEMEMEINKLSSEIGNTPIVYLEEYSKKYKSNIFVKLECKNPGGSVKDRVAYQMISSALIAQVISQGGTVIEPTSGNTGIGIALISRFFGLKTMLVMPESMSLERRKLLAAYGAELVLTPAELGMPGAIAKAEELVKTTENSFMPDQFNNNVCIETHYLTTAPEIEAFFKEEALKLDAFFAGVGTGATITGIGEYFKDKDEEIDIIAVEPLTSAVLSGEPMGKHGIQGLGAGFVPDNFHREAVDEIYKISTEEAIEEARNLMRIEGISCGISAGANMRALIKYAEKNEGKTLLTIIPDGVEKYLTTPLFD